jgi:hypothetical protein
MDPTPWTIRVPLGSVNPNSCSVDIVEARYFLVVRISRPLLLTVRDSEKKGCYTHDYRSCIGLITSHDSGCGPRAISKEAGQIIKEVLENRPGVGDFSV